MRKKDEEERKGPRDHLRGNRMGQHACNLLHAVGDRRLENGTSKTEQSMPAAIQAREDPGSDIKARRGERHTTLGEIPRRQTHHHSGCERPQSDGVSDPDIHENGKEYLWSGVRTGAPSDKTISEYVCSMCGITLAECRHWGPVCKKTRRRVCAECCRKCEHHIKWSGIWRCNYVTLEDRREQARQRAQERFNEENAKISAAYNREKKERARQKAIQAARARRKQEKTAGGSQ